MPGITETYLDHESPVRVVITPSQSSFFAGEQFSVTITFTNTRTPEAGPSKHPDHTYSQTRTHKRGAHSISSAPLAQPPTSPGTPRTLLNPSPRKLAGFGDDALPSRKGLVGMMKKGYQDGNLPQLIEQRRKKLLAKSLSVSISSQELEEQLGEGIIVATPASAPYSQQAFSDVRPSPPSPHIPSPLSRTDTLSLSSNHPHARKQSVLDGQFSLDVLSPTTSIPPQPYTPTTSNSTLSLSTISESSFPTPQPSASSSSFTSPTTPRISSPLSPSYSQPALQPNTSSNANAVQAYPSIAPSADRATTPRAHHHSRRFSQQIHLGLGPPPPLPNISRSNQTITQRNAYSATFPQSNNNNELILYSYAQLTGTVIVVPESTGSTVTPTQDQINRMNRIRKALIRRRVAVGGGSMDISQSLHSSGSSSISSSLSLGGSSGSHLTHHQPIPGGYTKKKLGHGRSVSFSASLMSLLSPAPAPMDERAVTTPPSPLNGSAAVAAGLKPNSGPGPGGGAGAGAGGPGLGLGLGVVDSPPPPPPPLGGGGIVEDKVDPEIPLPTFEAQPSMLAVDLSLPPGQSKSYTYTIKLPDVLPPTYKGRALRFSYELVVGTCRAGSSSIPSSAKSSFSSGTNSTSRVMKVPIRVYNHVTVDRPPKPYDILWPVSRSRILGVGKGKEKEIPETQGKVVEEGTTVGGGGGGMVKKTAVHLSPPKTGVQGSFEDLRQYTKRLVSSLPPPSPPLPTTRTVNTTANGTGTGTENENGINGMEEPTQSTHNGSDVNNAPSERSSSSTTSLPSVVNNNDSPSKDGHDRLRMNSMDEANREQEEEEDQAILGCREAVEILTRLPKKASYDVNKDGVKVAVLTFTKAAYRLGETVSGVVELNDRVGRARVLQLCAILEAHETLPTSIAPPQSARNLKRTYAEHHASFTPNTLRTTFALDIPSDASPAFQINMNDAQSPAPLLPPSPTTPLGGLEWKVRLCLLVAIASESSDIGTEGVRFKSLERDGPRGEWGSSWRAPSTLSPLEKPRVGLHHLKNDGEKSKTKSWTQLFVDSVWNTLGGVGVGGDDENANANAIDSYLSHRDGDGDGYESEGGVVERSYDGIKPDMAGGVGIGVDFAGGEEEGPGRWKEVKLETVECEVPIRVWPGNTAFRAVDVVFDV